MLVLPQNKHHNLPDLYMKKRRIYSTDTNGGIGQSSVSAMAVAPSELAGRFA
jgi:hypothetical protein